ncbi:glycosyltransferase [Lactobacillus gasseri]|uniref:glycosyltransferase n=1 Tax=Lactobacillus gasseri TaxID=1596 RepID=UPI0022DFE7FF|nr:glycosyltransferase [Lactobacillus gasseri]
MKNKSKIKVIHFVSGFKNGGVEQVLLNYTKLLNKRHDDIENVIVYQHTADFEKLKMSEKIGNRMIEIPAKREGIFKHLYVTYKLLKREKPDIVHAHMSLTSFVPLSVATILGIPVRIAHSHIAQDEFNPHIVPILKKLNILFATNLLACGEKAGKYMYGKKKFNILYNAIDQDKYKYQPQWKNEIRKKYHIGADSIVLGTIGRVVKQKNQEFLIDIFDRYNEIQPNSYLFIIGDGELSDDLNRYINTKKSKNKIIRISAVKSTEKLYSAFDIFLMPSLYEGLPVVAIEAQSSGIPTLLSENIDHSVIFSDKVDMLPINHGVKPWVKKLQFWVNTKDNRKFKGNNNYNIKIQYQRLFDFYSRWLKENKK